MHPDDARRCGVREGEPTRLASVQGRMIARVRLSLGQRLGCVFAPLHWSDEFAGAGRVNALVAPHVDPLSGQLESKQTPVAVASYPAAWRGFARMRERVRVDRDGYWALGRGDGHWRQELGALAAPGAWGPQARAWLGDGGEWLAFRDPAAGRSRFARLTAGRLDGCLFVGDDLGEVSRSWLGGPFAAGRLSGCCRGVRRTDAPIPGRSSAPASASANDRLTRPSPRARPASKPLAPN